MGENDELGWKKKRLFRFFLMFGIILLMFFVIEVLPLNLGAKHIPWSEIPSHIQRRLPIVLLIAAAASASLVFRKGNPSDKS